MSVTEWLSEDEMLFWRSFLATTGSVMAEVEAAVKADSGINFDDYEVLVHLSEADDHELRMSDLGDRLLHSRSRLTQRVDRMAKKGFVRRHKSAEDGRGTYAVLTDDGMAILRQASPDHLRAVRTALFDKLDADLVRTGCNLFAAIHPNEQIEPPK